MGRLRRPEDSRRRVAGVERHRRRCCRCGMFLVLYSLLLVLFLYLLNRKIQDGPEELEEVETVPMSSLPDTFRDVFSRSRRAADLGDEPMTLNDVWFFLFILIIAGYLILDGFDMGVGILLLPLARTDVERRTLLNSIGPVWDGNEVWLVAGWRRPVRGLPARLRVPLLGLVPRVRAGPARDSSFGRSPSSSGRRKRASAGGPPGTRSSPPRRPVSPCCSASLSGASWTVCRWTPTGTSRAG